MLPLTDVVDEVPQNEPLRHAVETKVVERRGVDAVLARSTGSVERARNCTPGYYNREGHATAATHRPATTRLP